MPTKVPIDDLAYEQSIDKELKDLLKDPQASIKFHKLSWSSTPDEPQKFFYANVDSFNIRPYVPASLRPLVFELFHGLAHPSAKITERMLRKFYIWPKISDDVALYCKACIPCQQSKITRHNKPAPMHFDAPDSKFQHIHVDLVGPLPEVQGYSYLLTMIDRFSRWPEAVPVKDVTAETVTEGILQHWISRFGIPSVITTDQGRQFEGSVFRRFAESLSFEHIHTTPYHPQSNGVVERWHRDLKAALMCRGPSDEWLAALPSVMLGLRARCILDTDMSPAEMLYDKTLRIPGVFCDYDNEELDVEAFRNPFLRHMAAIKPLEFERKSNVKPFYYQDLDTCSHVFKLIKAGKRVLMRPYTGPHKVVGRHASRKHMDIMVNNKRCTVSVNHLKPAYILSELLQIPETSQSSVNDPDKTLALTPQRSDVTESLIDLAADTAEKGSPNKVIDQSGQKGTLPPLIPSTSSHANHSAVKRKASTESSEPSSKISKDSSHE
ncbi:hypothetical protein TKK_0002517 [Trichogramma kaykai]|uniref:RNA-directed DNA polymerase n=1 Tax=Trichogramma kaykai TaxID=54128 RepID=A0ABD2WX32_9HYME